MIIFDYWLWVMSTMFLDFSIVSNWYRITIVSKFIIFKWFYSVLQISNPNILNVSSPKCSRHGSNFPLHSQRKVQIPRLAQARERERMHFQLQLAQCLEWKIFPFLENLNEMVWFSEPRSRWIFCNTFKQCPLFTHPRPNDNINEIIGHEKLHNLLVEKWN